MMGRGAPAWAMNLRERPRVYVVGAGRLGLGLARALRDAGYPSVGIWNRGAAGRRRAARLLGRRADGGELGAALGEAELIFVAVADRAISEVGAILAAQKLRPGTIVAHTSGALDARSLGRIQGAKLASFHPVVACAEPSQAAAALRGAVFTIEGDPRALRTLRQVARDLGGRTVVLAPRAKARYHAALVLASNLVVALLEVARREALAAGFADERALAQLACGAVTLVARHGTAAALTGPVRRGDLETLERHLEALSKPAAHMYRSLSFVAVELARRRGLPRKTAHRLLEHLRRPGLELSG